jgi:uncharacterized RDD family membrane protein YckC
MTKPHAEDPVGTSRDSNPDTAIPDAGPQLAGLLVRFASLLYEALLLAAILFGAAFAFLLVAPNPMPPEWRPALQCFLLVIAALYFTYCWTRTGQTLPMKTWRLRLVRRDGGPMSQRDAAFRFVFATCSLLAAGAGFLWPVCDPDRQFLHDRLAGTRIVRVPPRRSAPL